MFTPDHGRGKDVISYNRNIFFFFFKKYQKIRKNIRVNI